MDSKPRKKSATKLDEPVKELADCVKQLSCDTTVDRGAQLAAEVDPTLLAKWPKVKMKVPTIFVHKTVEFASHVYEILALGISFYQPYLSSNYIKIQSPSFEEHQALLKYLEEHELPHHTFGHPEQRKMRVVIRGLPVGTAVSEVAAALRTAGVALERAHQMHVKQFAKDRDLVILAIVPHSTEGRQILRVQRLLGHTVTLEPAIHKTVQCHRCQKWGHSQRYCRGVVKCVKCAGEHWSRVCERDRAAEAPTCANCGGAHAASYRQCFYCPDGSEYRHRRPSSSKGHSLQAKPKQIVTYDIAVKNLYKKINNIPKHEEAIPF